ncbi:MAG: hypothetical protein J2P38_12095 [Candidatus Dormibacteraeota bacterium]|nr:hypothetical protein [Candidatus Dormibacteraeota bacterium]
MSEDRRTILQRVASGELSPEEAAEQLDRLGAQPPPPPPPPEPGETPPFEPVSEGSAPRAETPPPSGGGLAASPLERVRVVRNLGATRIVGDREVLEAVAEGPHRAERLPHELVIHSDFDEEGGFNFSRIEGQWGRYRNARLNVRMRPDLPLTVQAQASSVQVQGVTGPISGDVQAGSLSVDGSEGPFDLTVQAGSLTVTGAIHKGTSRVRCEAGSVHVVLRPGSSVHIVTRSTLGYVSLPGEAGRVDDFVMGGSTRDVTVGSGEARLEIDATMGSVRITQE